MKIYILTAISCLAGAVLNNHLVAQCGTPVSLGSSFNLLTVLRNGANPVAADKNLNTIVFVHRHNSGVFGGNSGNLRYDYSFNGGNTWTIDQGVLNPVSTSAARYPNVAIYNPPGNTVPANAYLSYVAPTTAGTVWNGVATGVRQLNGSGNTENYNQPGASSYLIASSLVKGAPGTFWAIDVTSTTNTITNGVNIFRGVWNGVNNVNWTTSTTLYPPYDLTGIGTPIVGDWKIAFDPTGTIGWICLATHLSFSPTFNYGYSPVFYKTTNGGNTWSGPMNVDLYQFPCITSNIQGFSDPSMHYNMDLAVDVNGNPHLLTRIGHSDGSYGLDFNFWHRMYDITQVNGIWIAKDVAAVNGGDANYNGSLGSVTNDVARAQISRSADGSKLFFSWTDNTNYVLGAANTSPDFFSRGFDVVQNKWTVAKNFSSCNVNTAGKILFPHVAKEVLEPQVNQYKLAPVYAEFQVAGNPDMPVNLNFLDNVTFTEADFNVADPSANVNIIQGTSALLCSGSTINLQLNNAYPYVLWNNGSTSHVLPVNAPGVYSVTVNSGCLFGSATISVETLTLDVVSSSTNICEGSSITLSAQSNANSYMWTGGISTSSFIATPAVNTMYQVQVTGTECNLVKSVSITVNPRPTLSVFSNMPQICAGDQAVLLATGTADNYLWNTGATSNSIAISPNITTTYTVAGISSLGCSSTYSFTQVVEPCLGIRSTQTSEPELTVFPNPANDEVYIMINTLPENAKLELYNNIGQLIDYQDIKSERLSLNIGKYSQGIYFIQVTENGKTLCREKVIKLN